MLGKNAIDLIRRDADKSFPSDVLIGAPLKPENDLACHCLALLDERGMLLAKLRQAEKEDERELRMYNAVVDLAVLHQKRGDLLTVALQQVCHNIDRPRDELMSIAIKALEAAQSLAERGEE